MVRLDPPGTWCLNQAVIELATEAGPRTFCEVGVGQGGLAHALCGRGLKGTGIDFSDVALERARDTLKEDIAAGRFCLMRADFMSMELPAERFDLAVSVMVMEHIEDDLTFSKRLRDMVVPGGTVIVGVPAREDRLGVEDETAGHLRRYERAGLDQLMRQAGLSDVRIRSVAVPVANLTYRLSNLLVAWSGERRKAAMSQRHQTETSGVRDIPFKTVFPSPFRAILNPVAMQPLFVLQRAFYRTNLGLILLASGTRPLERAGAQAKTEPASTLKLTTASTTRARSSSVSRL